MATSYKNATADQLLAAIKAGSLSPGSSAWTAVYVGGKATQAQIDAYAMWQGYSTYRNSTAAQLLDAIKAGKLAENSLAWKGLYANGKATQPQIDADAIECVSVCIDSADGTDRAVGSQLALMSRGGVLPCSPQAIANKRERVG